DIFFQQDVMTATKNHGIDMVLNSLSRKLLLASWSHITEFETMVKISKHNFYQHAMLFMETFEANQIFIRLDLWQLS
ncbi:hypothetical protein BO83DRAFT_327442, partial [Aspergillus eucalypticola CBS 122712]